MRISFVPQRRDDTLVVEKAGDMLTINGQPFDFSELPDGATILSGDVPCDWITGPLERVSGALHLTLILPYGPTKPDGIFDVAPIVDPPDGVLILPFEEAADVEA
jgi:hypothetical protein